MGVWVYIGGFELPDGNAAAHRVLANARCMKSIGHDVVLVGVRRSGGDGLQPEHDLEGCDGIECWSVRYPASRKSWAKYLFGLRELFELLERKAHGLSGVICYNYPALAQSRLFAKARKLGGKCIADVTEWYEAGAGPLIFKSMKAADTWLRMNIVNHHADGIIAISPMLSQFYRSRGVPTVEIPTLFDTQVLSPPTPDAHDVRRRFAYVGNPFTEGRVNRDRTNLKDRLDVCVKLFRTLASEGYDFVFDIYGVECRQYLSVFPEDADFLEGQQEKIRFHGRVENRLVRTLLAASDFSIFVRDATRVTLAGFPTKLAESISLGTPVITSKHGNVIGYVGTPGLLLVERGKEYEGLVEVLRLTDGEVRMLKQESFNSRAFDYRRYEGDMSAFFRAVCGP